MAMCQQSFIYKTEQTDLFADPRFKEFTAITFWRLKDNNFNYTATFWLLWGFCFTN